MNKLRVLWFGLVALGGVLVVSCNKPAPEGPTVQTLIVRVNGTGTFVDVNGVVLVPSNPKYLSASMAYIYCQVEPEGPDPKKRAITLLADPLAIDGEAFCAAQPGGASDHPANAAVQALAGIDVSGVYEPGLYDAATLIVPLSFYIKKEATPELQAVEVAAHRFVLMCYTDQIKAGDMDLKLYVNHVVQGDVSTPRSELSYSFFRSYVLSDALAAYAAKSGRAKPTRLLICAQQSSASDQLGAGYSTEKVVEIPYSF